MVASWLLMSMSLVVALLPERAVAGEPGEIEARGARLAPLVELEASGTRASEHQLQLILSLGSAAAQQSSASSVMNVGLLYLSSFAGAVGFIGSGIGYHRTVSRVSGTAIGKGGVELLLTPRMITVPIAFKLALGSQFYAALEPALVVGWVKAAPYRTGGVPYDTSSKPGLGCQLGVGLDAKLSHWLGLALRVGYRAVRPSLTITPLARVSEPLTPRPQHVGVDLSGAFWDMGLVVRL